MTGGKVVDKQWFACRCVGCQADLGLMPLPVYLCPDCSAEQYERLAARLDASYDRMKPQEWATCSAALARLYGKGWEDRQAAFWMGW